MTPPVESTEEIRDGDAGFFRWFSIVLNAWAIVNLIISTSEIVGKLLACRVDGICH